MRRTESLDRISVRTVLYRTRSRHPRRRIGLIKIDPKGIIGEKIERPFLTD
jgi:hypothetical protein